MRALVRYILVFTMFILTAWPVFAESPREQFKQMVEQLQRNPADNTLRERIIKFAQELQPAPAIPEEAERRLARGMAAFKGAKSVSDYQDAVREFEQATLAAPWYGDAYYNLGVAQDKAESYEAALRSLKLAQQATPDSKEIKALIYEVEYRNEKAHSPEAVAAKQAALQQEKEAALLKSLEGAVFVIADTPPMGAYGATHREINIKGGKAVGILRRITVTAWEQEKRGHYAGQTTVFLECPVITIGRDMNCMWGNGGGQAIFKIASDGQSMTNHLGERYDRQ